MGSCKSVTSTQYSEKFISYCLNGDLINAKKYFEENPNIDIHADEEFAFRYSCDLGHLEWRSLKFEHEQHDIPDYQGNAAINHTQETVPYTRIIEHKHFIFGKQNKTIITKEYPEQWAQGKEKFYPINDEKNNKLYKSYKDRVNSAKYIMGGRLADYKYYDMHQVVGSALARVEKELI